MKFRKNAPPATTIDLAASLDAIDADIAALADERDAIEGDLPSLAAAPAEMLAQTDRLAAIETTLPHKRRTRAMLEAAIAEARKRDGIAAFERRKTEQERTSAKLARDLERRYQSAVDTFVSILREIADDEDACRRISAEASNMGLSGVWSAEFRLRSEMPNATRNGFESVASVARVAAWDSHRFAWSGSAPNGGAGHL